jgi:hypothetical protein
MPPEDEIRVTQNFGRTELLNVPWGEGGHFGGDRGLLDGLFRPGAQDPHNQRADSRAGAMSLLTGVAAVRSIDEQRPVRVDEIARIPGSRTKA